MTNNHTFKSYLLKVFDLDENELRKTLLLQLYIFILITTLLIVKPSINSLFLSELTANALPIGYIFTALFAVVGSYFYDKALEKFALNKIIEYTLLGCIGSLIVFALAFNSGINLGYLMYIPYIWVAIFGLLTTSQFWILTNLVYNIREAKRVFGFIGSGAIAGGIFGGYLTSLLSQFIETPYLFYIGAGLLLFCIPISRYIWKNEVHFQDSAVTKSRSTVVKGESPIKLIKQSYLLSWIALTIGLSVIVAKLVDYQYSHYASDLIENPEELTAFFGFWFSTLSVVSLFIQLFITKRVVGRFGVGNSVFLLPIGILIASILLLIFPELWVVIIIKIADGSLKQSVNKASVELLSIPIPIELKKKTKTFIDVVIDSIATGLAGLLLIFIINGLNIPNTYVTIIIIAFILLWMSFLYKLKKAYIESFKNLLGTDHHHAEKKEQKKEVPINTIVDTVNWIFKQGTESQILHMLNRVIESPDERFFNSIKPLLHHESDKIKAQAIESLYYLNTQDLSDSIEPLILYPDQEIAIDAFRYVLSRHRKNPYFYIDKYFEDTHDSVQNAVLIGMSLELNKKQLTHEKYKLQKWLDHAIETSALMKTSKEKTNKIITILNVIGNSRIQGYNHIVTKCLQSDSPEIVNAAIDNAVKLKDFNAVDSIVKLLSNKQHRENAITGLYNYGSNIIQYLASKTTSEKIELKNALFIPKIIEKFDSTEAIKVLISLIDHTEHAISIEAIESLQRLKWSNNKLQIKNHFVLSKILDECHMYQLTLSSIHSQILINNQEKNASEIEARKGLMTILEHRLDRQLHRIFKFLGLKFIPEEIEPIADIILKGDETQRVNAIEFLDNILDSKLKRELIPIAESAFIDNQITDDLIRKFNLKKYTDYECYEILLKLHDIKIKHAVLYLIEKTNDTRFIPLIYLVIEDPHHSIKQQAKSTLNYLKTQSTPA